MKVAAITAVGGYRRWYGERRSRELLLIGAWNHDLARSVDWAVGACLLHRRAALEAVGGYDDRFFMYAEDLEWCDRAAREGWMIWFEPDAVVRHVGNASGGPTFGRSRTEAVVANTYRYYRRHHGSLSTFAYRVCNIAGATRLLVFATLRRDQDARVYWRDQLVAHWSRRGRDDQPGSRNAP